MIESIAVRVALAQDLRYVVSLMRANRESVGGMPEPAIMERIDRGTVLLATINDDPVGYVLYDLRAGVLRVPQACIQYDARRRKYGEELVRQMMARAVGVREVSLRCAADLEANVFWRDMGFTCVGNVPGGKRRGRTINVWAMWLERKLVSLADVSRQAVAEMRQDSMYDDTGYVRSTPDGFREAIVLPKLAWSNRAGPDRQLVLPIVDNSLDTPTLA